VMMECAILIETSTKVCSVGIYQQGHLTASKTLDTGKYVHAETLLPILQEVISSTKLELRNISAIVVGEGPGSYTGLRIGASMAKGICFGLGIPLYAIDSGTIYAYYARSIYPERKCYVSLIDAGRMEAYVSIYRSDMSRVSDYGAILLEEKYFSAPEFSDAIFVGDGIEKAKHLLTSGQKALPKEPNVSLIALALPEIHMQAIDLHDFQPIYVKEYIPGKPKSML